MINRRMFLKSSATAVIALPLSTTLLEGCTASELEGYLNTVLTAAQNILGLSSSADGWYTDLVDAIAALKATESSWNGTTVVSAVIAALNTVDAVLAVIPFTATFSPLIDLLTTAIETILTTFITTKSMALRMTRNPHAGRTALKVPHIFQTKVGAFKTQWNDIVVGAQLPAATKL